MPWRGPLLAPGAVFLAAIGESRDTPAKGSLLCPPKLVRVGVGHAKHAGRKQGLNEPHLSGTNEAAGFFIRPCCAIKAQPKHGDHEERSI